MIYAKAWFNFPDGGLDDINNVFTDSSTYQPEVPAHEAEIIVSQP